MTIPVAGVRRQCGDSAVPFLWRDDYFCLYVSDIFPLKYSRIRCGISLTGFGCVPSSTVHQLQDTGQLHPSIMINVCVLHSHKRHIMIIPTSWDNQEHQMISYNEKSFIMWNAIPHPNHIKRFLKTLHRMDFINMLDSFFFFISTFTKIIATKFSYSLLKAGDVTSMCLSCN